MLLSVTESILSDFLVNSNRGKVLNLDISTCAPEMASRLSAWLDWISLVWKNWPSMMRSPDKVKSKGNLINTESEQWVYWIWRSIILDGWKTPLSEKSKMKDSVNLQRSNVKFSNVKCLRIKTSWAVNLKMVVLRNSHSINEILLNLNSVFYPAKTMSKTIVDSNRIFSKTRSVN